jgi:RNA polymerase sigma-70 factor (ECF subfamily)
MTRRAADALVEVYRRHAGQVSGLALGLCGDGRAEDVVQEVFLDLWQSPERFAGVKARCAPFC